MGRDTFWRASTGLLRLFVMATVLPICALIATAQTATTPASPGGVTSEKSAADRVHELKQKVERDVLQDLVKKAESGDATAQDKLGNRYQFHRGVEQDFNEAVKWYRKAAEQGHPEGQLDLARCYENGQGVAQDKKEAAVWYRKAIEFWRKAAEQGNAHAQAMLGYCYKNGEGVTEDAQEAAKWFRKAAENGDSKEQQKLAIRYAEGDGVPQDKKEAAKWFCKAADQDDALHKFFLGQRYAKGDGVPQDKQEAAKWFSKAEEQGDAGFQCIIGLFFLNGIGIPQDYQEAVKCYRKAAESGDASAQNILGDCYSKGQGVVKDDQEALKWYRMAAKNGDAAAQFYLGLYNDFISPPDKPEAAKWYRKAAEQGDIAAQSELGYRYEAGQGVTQDYQEAVKWYRKAAEQGDIWAECNLGNCYANGRGVTQNITEATKWYRRAAEQGHAGAQVSLGECYAKGEGVTKDDSEAVKWYRKAAEQGDAGGQASVGFAYQYGEGVPQDYVEAYKWYNLVAGQGKKWAGENRDRLSHEMTREQIAEAQHRAAQFVARPSKGFGDRSKRQPESADVPTGSGTGFIITGGKNPCVLTAHHVVKEASAVKVVMGGKTFPARVVGADPANDLAVLQFAVGTSGLRDGAGQQASLPITASRSVKLGDTVFTVGFPDPSAQGVSPKLTRGEISSLAGIQDDPRYFQTSVAVQPGNSGGALVDARGNVVGVITMRLNDLETLKRTGSLPQNVNYGLKSSFVLAFLESLSELAPALPPPHTDDRKFEDVVKEVQQASVLVLTY